MRKSSQTIPTVLPGPARLAGLAVAIGAIALLAACAPNLPVVADPFPEDPEFSQPPPAEEVPYPVDSAFPSGDEDAAPPTVPDWIPADEAEILLRNGLELAAEGNLQGARDHLNTLDYVNRSVELAGDEPEAARWRSLDRRSRLLRALLLEIEASLDDEAAGDSLLASGYANLTGRGFPDSLVPATGVVMDGIKADLLRWDNHRVEEWITYFTGRGKTNFQVWLERKEQVKGIIEPILLQKGLPAELIYLAMIESGITPQAVSSVGAAGPWQFMTGTAKAHGLAVDWWIDQRRDLEASTRAAADYLGRLHERFGDWSLVLAAYNTGENRIERKIREHGHDNFWSLRLPAQTTDFVPKFIAAARIGEDPAAYGFELADTRPLAYETVPVDDATDLNLIAECAGVAPGLVRDLNPALRRGASPPGRKGYPVKVPPGTGAKAAANLAKVPADRRLTWSHHRVGRGETLSGIASRYGTTVADIARVNKLGDVHLIRPGDNLLIPMPADLADRARSRADEKGHYVPPDGYSRTSYTVKKGDTLGGIARKLGVTLTHLRRVNNLHGTSLIKPGQKLYAYRPEK